MSNNEEKSSGIKPPEWTMCPNQLLDNMADFSDAELRITLAAIREIVGWHKSEAQAMSYSWFREKTGLSNKGVQDGVEAAKKRGWLMQLNETGQRNVRLFTLNFDFSPDYVPEVHSDYVPEVQHTKKVLKEIKEKDSIAPKTRDFKKEILSTFNSNKSVKLNTLEISLALGFKSDVFDILSIGDSENYNHVLQELYRNGELSWKDTATKRLYWLAALGESKADGNELDTIADLIASEWKVNGGREKNLAHMLQGSARDNRYKSYTGGFKGDKQITLDEIRQYPIWCKTKFGDGCELPLAPEKLAHRILQMREENKSNPTQNDINEGLNAGYVPD